MVFPIGGLVQVLPLLVTHAYLILINKTTWEQVLRREVTYLQGFPFNSSPFSKGICENVKEFFRMAFVNVEWTLPVSGNDYKAYVETNKWLPGHKERMQSIEDMMLDAVYEPTLF